MRSVDRRMMIEIPRVHAPAALQRRTDYSMSRARQFAAGTVSHNKLVRIVAPLRDDLRGLRKAIESHTSSEPDGSRVIRSVLAPSELCARHATLTATAVSALRQLVWLVSKRKGPAPPDFGTEPLSIAWLPQTREGALGPALEELMALLALKPGQVARFQFGGPIPREEPETLARLEQLLNDIVEEESLQAAAIDSAPVGGSGSAIPAKRRRRRRTPRVGPRLVDLRYRELTVVGALCVMTASGARPQAKQIGQWIKTHLGETVSKGTVKKYVWTFRRRKGAAAYIESIPGRGYRMKKRIRGAPRTIEGLRQLLEAASK